MLKSSIFKKVISVVLALATVCTFSMVSCFAQGDDTEEWKHDFGKLNGKPCHKFVSKDGKEYLIYQNEVPQELRQFLIDNNLKGADPNED